MADPVGLSSGLLALATFAFTSSKALYEALQSFQNQKRIIRDLRDELEALQGVLHSLQQTLESTHEQFDPLKLPLSRCGQACNDFRVMIENCTSHSTQSRASFRDWAKLTYMGGDITSFKDMLAGYKATITIALGDMNMRTARLTTDVIEQYTTLIQRTTQDLQEHLQDIEDRLEDFSSSDVQTRSQDAAREQLEQEMESTRLCLTICAEVSAHIARTQTENFGGGSLPNSNSSNVSPRKEESAPSLTANALEECRANLMGVRARLETYLEGLNEKIAEISLSEAPSLSQPMDEQSRMLQERESTRQALAICSQASEHVDLQRTNTFTEMSMADDGNHVIVSTIGDLISVNGFKAGNRTTTIMGQMSDAALQSFSQRFRPYVAATASPKESSPSERGINTTDSNPESPNPEPVRPYKFESQYGSGRVLSNTLSRN